MKQRVWCSIEELRKLKVGDINRFNIGDQQIETIVISAPVSRVLEDGDVEWEWQEKGTNGNIVTFYTTESQCEMMERVTTEYKRIV